MPNLRGLVRLHSILVLLVCQIVARTISGLSFFLDCAILPFWSMLALSMASTQALFTVKRIHVLEETRIFFLSSSRLPVSGHAVHCTVLLGSLEVF